MLIIDSHNCIKMTRGDSACIDVDLINEDEEKYIMCLGDILKFTVKNNVRSKEFVIQKKYESNQIVLSPEDTSELNYGNYVFDIELITSSGDVYTVVPMSTFKICEEVG